VAGPDRNSRELPAEKLRWQCDPSAFPADTTRDIRPAETIVGQDRALEAVRLGLAMRGAGYNIFVCGLTGTGRTTTVRQLLEQLKKGKDRPPDIAYVHNFHHPDMPRVLRFDAGHGAKFKDAMRSFITRLQEDLRGIFESEGYKERRRALLQRYESEQKELIKSFEERAKKQGFALVQVQMGPVTRPALVPAVDGKPVPLEELESRVQKGEYDAEELAKLRERHATLQAEMAKTLAALQTKQAEAAQSVEELNFNVTAPLVEDEIARLEEKFGDGAVSEYLDEVKAAVLAELGRFIGKEGEEDEFTEYKVNVVVDNSRTKGRPIVVETAPTFRNLFGTIERVPGGKPGVSTTDHTRIRVGSILHANGGFLVLNVGDVLAEAGVWQALKRTLRNAVVEIQAYDPLYFLGASGLKPEPVHVDVKVVMVGEKVYYQLLYALDEDFSKVFKVKADFDSVMPLNKRALVQYAAVASKICKQEELLSLDREALATLAEEGVRLAGRTDKITTRFSEVADVVREADYWARREGVDTIGTGHIEKAVAERERRVNLPEEKIQELIRDGVLMIDTAGKVVGQVNGLSVYDLGDYAFGVPTRITATTSVGRSGVINIEREADLSGSTHSKGVLILAGYLRGKYAHDKPMAMNASICFEQSYGGVDGDSASSTEAYAILSSLSELPIRQDVAVTGSINQKGEIQPIGGVNEKIEGFFILCKAKGLSGTQGVVIPRQNVKDLMLKQEVVDAVGAGKFHIWAIASVDEGVEILTGVPAGARGKDGKYPPDTVNALADQAMAGLAGRWREYARGEAV
jgi:lon-related putative ATP-dependent protease